MSAKRPTDGMLIKVFFLPLPLSFFTTPAIGRSGGKGNFEPTTVPSCRWVKMKRCQAERRALALPRALTAVKGLSGRENHKQEEPST
ncbi:hypothetical protein B0F90DRAFT_1762035 [Multifurca ochricompacta]|uniref:Secreted protein n=1 Tax=Multifurca ochricompacta TaxID=376703 RepID=A0AAD4QGJ6_9AGAM|nr:hypothetical protein B0F90DRAFT_1762035 [Multifurca ochricompacta]